MWCRPCTDYGHAVARSRPTARLVRHGRFLLESGTSIAPPAGDPYWQTVLDHLDPDQPDQET